jgi:chemotaxis protein MotB
VKKREDEPKKGAPAYMNTYGDMMTLLLTFFVLLFSMSSVDATKFKAIIASFEGGTGVLSGGETVQENTAVLGNGVKHFPEGKNKKEGTENAGTKEAEKAVQQMKENLEKYIKSQNMEEKVTIEQDGSEIILRFDDILLFDTGKADIKAGAVPVLDKLGLKLREYLEAGYRIRLEGHTDNVPIKTMQFPTNW